MVLSNITLRVYGIPSAITEDDFLHDIEAWLSKTFPKLSAGKYITRWSFAPVPTCTYEYRNKDGYTNKQNVATITLDETPNALHNGGNFVVSLKGRPHTLAFDSHFHGLTPLNNPADQPIVDIIAVTGLAGHAFGSWKSRGENTMWLRDFLPEHVPTARILTYGYDSTLHRNLSISGIDDFSTRLLEVVATSRSHEEEKQRPIIFIGHSLGGIVIKHALIKGYRSELLQQRQVFMSSYAMIFFGTPNRGLQIDTLRSMVKGQPNARLVEDLAPRSRTLNELHQEYCRYLSFSFSDTQIVSVYETQPTKTVVMVEPGVWRRGGPPVLMVNKESATYSGPDEKRHDQLAIDRDHSDITKFTNHQDPNFIPIRQRIIDYVRDAPVAVRTRFDSRNHRR